MRRFHLLAPDSRLKGCHALVPDNPRFDLYFEYYQVSRCQRLPEDALMAAPLLEKPGKKVDFVGNPLGWPIVSSAMLGLFNDFAGDDIQPLRFQAVDSTGRPVLTDYRVVNVLRCIDQAVDLEESVTSCDTIGDQQTLNIITFVFRVDKVAQDIHLFRPRESLFYLVVSEELAKAMHEAKLKGYALIETGSV